MILDSEKVLSDGHPVFGDYVYVVDGKLVRSDIFGNVAKLKANLRQYRGMEALEVRNCDIFARIELEEKGK